MTLRAPLTPLRPDRREEVLSECAPLKMTLLQRGLIEAALGAVTDPESARPSRVIVDRMSTPQGRGFDPLTAARSVREMKRRFFAAYRSPEQTCRAALHRLSQVCR